MKKYILTLLFALMAAAAVQAQSYEEFQENLKEAKAGNDVAQYNVGLYYHNGWSGVKQDYQQAAYWYRKSADQGFADAQVNLGYLYNYGLGVAQSNQQAVYWYRRAADQGNEMAQTNLAHMYYYGKGVDEDYVQAAYWYRKAADQGYSAAQREIGNCYYSGKGVSQDYKQAAYWYEKAAVQGDVDAQSDLARMYHFGNGVSQDYAKAVQWYKKAAEQGDFFSQYNLADLYYEGKDVPRDYSQAAYWYRKASEYVINPDNKLDALYKFFIVSSQCRLGLLYEQGLGVTQNYSEAIALYKRAISIGDYAEPYFRLGVCYENGRGVQKNISKAIECYEIAAEDDYAEALTRLGDFYYEGIGVVKDYEQAAEYYIDAAYEDDPKGTYMLGYFYETGLVAGKKIDDAAYYYKKAAELGSEPAIAGLKRVYDADKDNSFVFQWISENQGSTNPYAQYVSGCYRFEGHKLEQDYDKAKTLLDNASAGGVKDADRILNDPANAKIWRKVETDRKRAEAKAEREYRLWKFGRYMSTFNCPKGYTRPFGVSVGYVSKRWDNIWSDGSKEHSSVFDDTKLINGVQAGVRWEPQLKYGFGFDTGLYYEYYQDKSDMMDDGDGYGPYFVRMSEHCLHFPAHVEYRLNFTEDFQVFFYGGVALDFVLYGKFDYFDEGYEEPFGTLDEEIYAGEVLPDVKRFNASWSFGGGVRFMAFQLNAGTRMGFYNMSSSPDYKVYQNNPFLISLSFMF